MLETPFETYDGCEQFLRNALGLQESVPQEIAALLRAAAEISDEAKQKPLDRLEFRVGRWVIRDADLDLYKTMQQAVITMAGSSFVLRDLKFQAVVGLLAGVVYLLRNAYR